MVRVGTVHEQLSPERLQDGSQLCPCYSKLVTKSPFEGQASSVGAMSRKDVLLALAALPLGHHAWVPNEIPYTVPLPEDHWSELALWRTMIRILCLGSNWHQSHSL